MAYKSVAFASRFLSTVEVRYIIIILELLGVVWSIENFKYYLNGKFFNVITDHRALFSILRKNRACKSYNSRLASWIDRLFSSDFTTIPIDYLHVSKIGLLDYILRDPQQKTAKISTYDEQFIVTTVDAITVSSKRFCSNTQFKRISRCKRKHLN